MSCLICLVINFKNFKNFHPPKPWTRSLSVSHHIVHRLSCSTQFTTAAMGLSNHVFSPTLASHLFRTRTSTNAVDNCFCALAPTDITAFQVINLISSYQRKVAAIRNRHPSQKGKQRKDHRQIRDFGILKSLDGSGMADINK